MNIFGKLMESMRVNSDDDDYYDDEEEFDDKQPAAPARGKDDEEEDDVPAESKPRFFARSKVTPVRRNMEVSLVKPTSFDDARVICDYLLGGKAVVLNMEGIQTEIAQRIIDFTSGATYSMDGKLQKISNYIFIVTPASIDLSGDFQNLIASSGSLDISGLNMHV
jgi:cell division inhibitor SepF